MEYETKEIEIGHNNIKNFLSLQTDFSVSYCYNIAPQTVIDRALTCRSLRKEVFYYLFFSACLFFVLFFAFVFVFVLLFLFFCGGGGGWGVKTDVGFLISWIHYRLPGD